MKRWLVRICVLLLLGAIVNVAVAWWFAWKGATMAHRQEPVSQETRDIWHVRKPAGFPSEIWSDVSYTTRTAGLDYVMLVGDSGRPVVSLHVMSWRCAGWPFRALAGGEARTSAPGVSKPSFVARIDAVRLGGSDSDGFADKPIYPLRPIWPGFAINTVFYAAVLWLLFALGGTPFALRRRRRIKRGLCPKCAYDLRGSTDATACPECGATHSRVLPRPAQR